jgi:large subunit ribosomal protein L5
MTDKLSLKDKYTKVIAASLAKEFGIKSKMAIPKVEKVVVNMGIGQAGRDKAKLNQLSEDLAAITGQAPSVRKAKASIAGFNVREGLPVGLKVTLRGVKMYDFLARLFTIVLPRLRDFRGVSLKSFDKEGNYNLGMPEHSVFPEIDIGKSGAHGVEITIVTTAGEAKQSKKLLELLGMPFEKEEA